MARTRAQHLPQFAGNLPGRKERREEEDFACIPYPGFPEFGDRIAAAVRRTQAYYLEEQHPEGYWWYPLQSNETITAEYIMLFRFLGIRDEKRIALLANHILERQRDDGTWSIYHGGPGDLSTTVEAYFALKLAGRFPEDRQRRAREFILEKGGAHRARIFTKIFLALFGCYPWHLVPSLPVELLLLPPSFFFSVYDFSSWARATLIPISVLLHKKPVKKTPSETCIREILGSEHDSDEPDDWLKRLFWMADKVIKYWERIPSNGFRDRALAEVEQWIVSHQESSGDWAGIQPAMVNSLLALHTLGYPVDHPVIQRGLKALERFCIHRGESLELQACVSPVWDTALTCMALMESGIPPQHPAIQKAARWLLSKQIFRSGDWRFRVPWGKPAGWAFEFYNDHYPDVDDSAVVLMVLRNALNGRSDKVQKRLKAGVEWVLSMRSSDGGWGAFDRNNNKWYLNKIPFADLEAMIDPSTCDLTGRVLEMMSHYGYPLDHPVVERAIRFLRKHQDPDGPWWGRWGVNYIYGTWSVLSGLAAIGENMKAPYVRRAVEWLKCHQNPDGGWGETCESYANPALKGCGESTPSQTAWSLLALMAAGEGGSEAVRRGILYLLNNQTARGVWEEEAYTGTGFPKYFMIRYHNYRNCFPLLALGRYRRYLEKGVRKEVSEHR